MKTTVIAGILFLLVLVFLGVNFYMLNAIFDETLALFSTLPVSAEALEQASEEELAAIDLRLNEIYGLWQKHETYLCFGLEHAASRSFLRRIFRRWRILKRRNIRRFWRRHGRRATLSSIWSLMRAFA